MRFTIAAGLAAVALPGPALGLIGYGITMYEPSCAFGCRDAISGYHLECSVHDAGPAGAHSHGAGGPTSPECRAGDTAFLTTLAYCMNATCGDTPAWKLEKYWTEQATGDKTVLPKWTYAESLHQIVEPPTQYAEDDMLHETSLFDQETWASSKATREHFELAETVHSRYGIILLVVGAGTPVLFTLLSYLPYASIITDKVRPYLVWPSLVGTYQVRPLPFLLGNAPTIGQALYVFMFLALNVILAAAGYQSTQPNTFFANEWQEIMGYISARTGVLAFALTPLVVLFAGRNNILLFFTNWSHSTYLLLHRWMARIYTLQVIIHSITELLLYMDMGAYEDEFNTEYWAWGIVATVFACAAVVFSQLIFRRFSYELFLISHVIFAIFIIAGCWYHVEFLFTRKWGYEFWLYAACAVWFADRLVRVLRILKNGPRRAAVTQVAEDIVRVDIGGIRWSAEPGKHTYAYFPTLSPLRPWENHPFSVVPTALLAGRRHHNTDTGSSSDLEKNTANVKTTATTTTSSRDSSTERSSGPIGAGITLYVRKSAGLTSLLKTEKSLFTLLDGPYPDNPTAGVLKTDRLLLVAGGIGITGVLPYIARHGNVKLAWGVRESAEGLVRDLDQALEGVEKDVRIGERLDVAGLLAEEEAAGWERVGVVVCGPGGLCDDVRAAVVRRGRAGPARWELEVDAFSW